MTIDWIALVGVVLTAIGLLWQHFWTRAELRGQKYRENHDRLVYIPVSDFLKKLLSFEFEIQRTIDEVHGADLKRLVRHSNALVREGSLAIQSADRFEGGNWQRLSLQRLQEATENTQIDDVLDRNSASTLQEQARWIYAAVNAQLQTSLKNVSA